MIAQCFRFFCNDTTEARRKYIGLLSEKLAKLELERTGAVAFGNAGRAWAIARKMNELEKAIAKERARYVGR